MNIDFEMQHALTVIIVLLIVGVVLDGIRRMRQSRRDSIRMSLKMQHNLEDGQEYGSELPNGGARVLNRELSEADDLNSEVRKAFSPVGTKPRKIPEQVSLNLDEKVPMLMDSVSDQAEQLLEGDTDERREPVFNETESSNVLDEGVASPARTISRPEPAPQAQAEESSGPEEPEEVIIINVMAAAGTRFQGEALLNVLLNRGMRFGTMNIFHRHLETDGSGEILFSMANMVVPGTFDLDAMSEFETPGVSFFLTLPINADSLTAFETMVDTTQALCDELGGELKDENRSVMTQQTIEHCRQRVQEFTRLQLSR